jgi:hypothetical protein
VECSSKNTGDSVAKLNWKKIWDLQAPNKLKCLFGAHNILASRMKIMRLGVDLDIACPVWHSEDGGQTF